MKKVIRKCLIERETIYIMDKDINVVRKKRKELKDQDYKVSKVYWGLGVRKRRRIYECQGTNERVI